MTDSYIRQGFDVFVAAAEKLGYVITEVPIIPEYRKNPLVCLLFYLRPFLYINDWVAERF